MQKEFINKIYKCVKEHYSYANSEISQYPNVYIMIKSPPFHFHKNAISINTQLLTRVQCVSLAINVVWPRILPNWFAVYHPSRSDLVGKIDKPELNYNVRYAIRIEGSLLTIAELIFLKW